MNGRGIGMREIVFFDSSQQLHLILWHRGDGRVPRADPSSVIHPSFIVDTFNATEKNFLTVEGHIR